MRIITYKRSSINSGRLTSHTDFITRLTKDKQHIFGLAGRTLLYSIFKTLAIPIGSNILIPEFLPQGIKLPLERMEMKLVYYQCDEFLTPNADLVTNLIKSYDIKVIFLIHYFGFSINFDLIAELCNRYGIWMIEDCAQALFNYVDREYKYNSIVLYSFPKYLSVPDGALAVFNISGYDYGQIHDKYKRRDRLNGYLAILFHRISLILRKTQTQVNFIIINEVLATTAAIMYAFYYKALCFIRNPVPISKSTLDYLKHFDYKTFISIRENNFHLLEKLLSSFDTAGKGNDQMSLLGFVLKTQCTKRKMVIKILKHLKIEVLSYRKGWYLEHAGNSSPSKFFRQIIILPINENLLEKDLIYVAENLKKVSTDFGVSFARL
jgi:hypothetical protein